MKDLFIQIYNRLFDFYGPQGWWPAVIDGKSVYSDEYTRVLRPDHAFGICVGAILTQNTNWQSVVKAIINLQNADKLYPAALQGDITEYIRPTGYYNQKAKKLAIFAAAWEKYNWHINTPSREELLALWGIGEETADDMLLYAFGTPVFIVDSYTKRLLANIGMPMSDKQMRADAVAQTGADIYVLRELHALIDWHAGTRCKAKGGCKDCPLSDICGKCLLE